MKENSLTRREFIKFGVAGIITASTVFLPSRKIEASTPKEFTEFDAFTNPLQTIDNYAHLLDSQSQTKDSQEFIELFVKGAEAEENRKKLDKFYKQEGYGQLVYSLYSRAEKLDALVHFPVLVALGGSLSNMYRGTVDQCPNINSSLNKIIKKCEFLEKSPDYESQKRMCMEKAREEQKDLWIKDRAKNYEGLLVFREAMDKYLPPWSVPYSGSIDIDPTEPTTSSHNHFGITLSKWCATLFVNLQTLHSDPFGAKMKNVIHEINHGFDPYNIRLGGNTLHPRDNLEYIGSYLSMLEKFYEGINSFSIADIQKIFNTNFLEPDIFGTGFLHGSHIDDLNVNDSEIIDRLNKFHNAMQQKSGRGLLKEIGMPSFFPRNFPINTNKENHDTSNLESVWMFRYFIALTKIQNKTEDWKEDYQFLKTIWIEQTLFHVMTGPCALQLDNYYLSESEFKRADHVRDNIYNVSQKVKDWIFWVFYRYPAEAQTRRMKMLGADFGLMIPGDPDPSEAIVTLAKLLSTYK